MKNLYRYFILTLLVVLTSCSDNFLNVTPDGRVTLDDVFANTRLTESYLNSIYNSRQSYGTAYHYWTMQAGFTDEAQDSDALSQSWTPVARWARGDINVSIRPFQGGGASQGSGNSGWYYEKNWEAIRKANIFLANIDEANVPIASERARMKAEARILRAFFYMEQIKMYGPMPVIDEPIPEVFDFGSLERGSFEAAVNLIVEDLDAAIAEPALPYRVSEPERGRFSKALAYHLKSEALVFNASPLWNPDNDQAKWQRAATASKEALDNLTTNGYELFGDYEEYFHNSRDLGSSPSDRETIWEIKDFNMTASFSILVFRMHNIPIPGATADKAGAAPSQNLVDAYDMADGSMPILGYSDEQNLEPIINPISGYDDSDPYVNRDPRFYATVWYDGAEYGVVNGELQHVESYQGGGQGLSSGRNRTHTGYYLRKFRDPAVTSANAGNSKFPKYRLAETYLFVAEAENEANGPTTEAYDAINAVRDRAGMPDLPVGLSKEEMRERIRRERQVELSYEEKRFWDVRRWEIIDEKERYITGMRWTSDGDNDRILVQARGHYEDKFLLFPIPLNEMNRLQTFEQNPGW
ncbi:MAG: RagB/SusD family nutrient uptake outer membrane protein [Balneolales bacterium]